MNNKRLTCLAVAVAMLALTAYTAPRNGKGGDPAPNATLTFDDLAGDAIQSDGGGSYDARVETDLITVSTGRKRGIWFDFSDCLAEECEIPFGSTTSGTISNVTLEVSTNPSAVGAALFLFSGSGGERMLFVEVKVTESDDDNDGTTDRYTIEPYYADALHTLLREVKGGGRFSNPDSTRWEATGFFSMPWSIEVIVN